MLHRKEWGIEELEDKMTPEQYQEVTALAVNIYLDYMGVNKDNEEEKAEMEEVKKEKKLDVQSESKYEIDFDWLFYIAKVHLNYSKKNSGIAHTPKYIKCGKHTLNLIVGK